MVCHHSQVLPACEFSPIRSVDHRSFFPTTTPPEQDPNGDPQHAFQTTNSI